MARPKKDENEKRTEQTNERWTLAEIEYLDEQAHIAGMARSEFIRRRALSLPVTAAPAPGGVSPALVSELNRIGVNLNQITKAMNAGRGLPCSLEAATAELQETLRRVLSDGA